MPNLTITLSNRSLEKIRELEPDNVSLLIERDGSWDVLSGTLHGWRIEPKPREQAPHPPERVERPLDVPKAEKRRIYDALVAYKEINGAGSLFTLQERSGVSVVRIGDVLSGRPVPASVWMVLGMVLRRECYL